MTQCNFRVGQRVVCVRDAKDIIDHDPREAGPQKDSIYTVREVLLEDDGFYLLFDEIRNQPRYYADGYGEVCWHHEGFRPVVDRKTDISIFKALLTPSKEKVETAS